MCVLFTTQHCIHKTDSDVWRGWQPQCSWTSTWRRTRSSNSIRRLARIRANSRWQVLSLSARLLHKNSSKTKKSLDLPLYVQVICYFFQDYLKSTCFRWTSRSWRTRWRIESRNMLLCNTLGTRRQSKSNLIHHHTLLFTQYLCWALLDRVPTKMQVCRRWPNFKSRLLAKYGVVSERMRSTLANVEDVPVDIRSSSHSHKYSLHPHKYSLHPHKYSVHSHYYSEFLSSTFWC